MYIHIIYQLLLRIRVCADLKQLLDIVIFSLYIIGAKSLNLSAFNLIKSRFIIPL